MEERRRRKAVKLMDKEFCVTSCCSRNIHGGKTWEEVKHIAHGARNTTISLAKQVGLPQLVVVKYAAIDDSDTLQRQSEVHAKFQGCPYILRCYGDEYCTAKDNGLDCIHNKGYAHLDIKPKNILLVPDLSKKRKRGPLPLLLLMPRLLIFGLPRVRNRIGGAAMGRSVVFGRHTAYQTGESLEDFSDRIGFGGESPRIPVGISREAQDFLKRCFVRNSKSRWTASRSVVSPFLKRPYSDAESPHKKIISTFLSLADLIKDHYSDDGGLLESDVKAFAKSILFDLEYIHKKGYAHLDINPDNIVLVPRGDHYSSKKMKIKRSANSGASADDFVAKIADFATAKSFNQISTDFVYAIE
ncbi:hypothetical protein Syun_008739 [Stephania yunnanensis]|uniref:Protein kinase domain-containing protein n=1 Tax=Stephania yunnanensis TaxID=152371 RepID=A0AAP0PQ99_9MAGN